MAAFRRLIDRQYTWKVKLNAYAAERRLKLFEEIRTGAPPSEGTFDPVMLEAGRKCGAPQMGSTRYEPDSIVFEFIFSDPQAAAVVLSVRLPAPRRIVFLPVPEWVVESIWQGEVDGSYHFEDDAIALLSKYSDEIEPEENAKWFEKRMAKRRE